MCSDSDDEGPPPALVHVADEPYGRLMRATNDVGGGHDGDDGGDEAGSGPSTSEVDLDPRDREPVPVLLLTGFLGAGKSTLVQFILTARHGHRIAVVMNEIGDTADIEKAAMIAEPESLDAAPVSDWVELENGCICCSAKNDLVLSMERLLQQRDRFDYIIIEGTGLMDPGAVAAALWTDDEMQAGSICLDAIVTVVDAKNILKHLDDARGQSNHAQKQVAYADVLLLNKVDLVDDSRREEVASRLRALSDAKIIECERCVVDLGSILGTGLYQGIAGNAETDPDAAMSTQLHEDGDGRLHHHHHHHHGHGHVSAVDTAVETFLIGERLDIERLREMLDSLLWEDGDTDIYRAKGLIHAADGSAFVLQAVGDVYELKRVGLWEPGNLKPSKLVFIGRGLERAALLGSLLGCRSGVDLRN